MSDGPRLEVREPESGSNEVAALYDPASPFGGDTPVAWLEYDEGRGRLRWYVRPRAATTGDESMRAPSLEYVTTLAGGDEALIEQISEVTSSFRRLATKYASKLEKSRDRSDRMTSQQLRNDLRSDGLKLSHG
jgi:hypothetical protein